MRIATWNVNGLRARLGFLLLWLRERRPDLVGLQEIKLSEEHFPHALFEAEGYRAVVHGQKAWNGVAILSRGPVTVTQKGLPGQEDHGARLIGAETEGLSFTTVYCPNGKDVGHPDFPRKLAWLDALAAHLRELRRPDRPAVLCGDFNICPAPIDSWNEDLLRGTIFHTSEERARFAALVESGFHDLFRGLHPDTRAYSWWDYRAGAFPRNRGLRLDLLLATPDLAGRLRSVQIDRDYRKKKGDLIPSDHAPVFADLEAPDVRT
jgi:exodeoxyribonuclease-3